jgi:hypothetical protein
VTNLREQIETDLSFTLENNEDFGLPVILYGPDGKQDKSANDPTADLMGQINYDTILVNPDTGEEIRVNNPNVSLRRSSLDRVPVAGETWAVAIPTTPSLTGDVSYFVIDATRAPGGGASIGFIVLYLRKARTPDEIAKLIFQDTKDSEWTDTEDTEFIDSP